MKKAKYSQEWTPEKLPASTLAPLFYIGLDRVPIKIILTGIKLKSSINYNCKKYGGKYVNLDIIVNKTSHRG